MTWPRIRALISFCGPFLFILLIVTTENDQPVSSQSSLARFNGSSIIAIKWLKMQQRVRGSVLPWRRRLKMLRREFQRNDKKQIKDKIWFDPWDFYWCNRPKSSKADKVKQFAPLLDLPCWKRRIWCMKPTRWVGNVHELPCPIRSRPPFCSSSLTQFVLSIDPSIRQLCRWSCGSSYRDRIE
jgi:hypothetical protein